MKVFVYGTLKRGYGNNILLREARHHENYIVKGYKLYNSGFPVAAPAEDSSVSGEIYDIGDPDTDIKAKAILNSLDRLESNGYMYDRVVVDEYYGEPLSMYVGCKDRWPFERMTECPSEDNIYTWSRN